jgi:hypothetical protein
MNTTLRFLVYRQEKIMPSNFMLVEAEVRSPEIDSASDLLKELKLGITKWANLDPDGRKAFAYAGKDINIGDIAGYDIFSILTYTRNIFSLRIESIDACDDWVYDEPLFTDEISKKG